MDLTEFTLSCCRLFEKHPLYHYRAPSADVGHSRLFVLLLGYGSRLDTILQEVLTNGQLRNTALDVTVANTNAAGTMESLLKRAPSLPQFAQIFCDMEPVSAPANSLCTLRFDTVPLSADAMEDVLLERSECAYILISTGNDEKNRALAEACAACTPDQRTLISYVQKKEPAPLPCTSPLTQIASFGYEKAQGYQDQLEQLALNLHYSYAKANNEREPMEQIVRTFQEPYNYLSNLKSAVHIRSKLACCGIDDADPREAAAKFSRLLAAQPALLEELSALEHSRWLMEKLLQGYGPLDDLDKIYRDGATTHSSAEKWHCCLVPNDPSGQSRLLPEDWANADGPYRPELDELDKMSLQIHAQCRKRAAANARQVDACLHLIQTSLTSDLHFSQQTLTAVQDLERAILQMRLKKKSAIPLYRAQWQLLKTQIEQEGELLAPLLLNSLDSLNAEVAPLIESISQKDYKAQDRVLVEQIPFALTHKCRPTLLKVLSGRETEDLFSAWQLEPDSLILIGRAASVTELSRIRAGADHIAQVFAHAGAEISPRYYLCVPEQLLSVQETDPALLAGWNCQLLGVRAETLDCFADALGPVLAEHHADYLDVTGGDPLLVKAVEQTAQIPSFYVRNGRLCNLAVAAELEYPAPVKGITVREMFALSGAIFEESESEKLSDLSLKYRELWDIAQSSENWTAFCSLIAAAYRQTPRAFYGVRPPRVTMPAVVRQVTAGGSAATALLAVLRQLEQHQIVDSISVHSELGEQHTISFQVLPNTTSPNSLSSFLQRCCNAYRPTDFYTFKTDSGTLFLTLCDLQVRELTLEEPVRRDYTRILEALAKNKLILNYRYDEDTAQYSFQFASKDVLACIQKSGTILEYVLYYAALLDAHFTDVDMGYKFQHSADKDAAENEIDIVCTKGTASLFISAKMVSARQLALNNKLNYVLYEIALLADRFGINAKPVLAAPFLDQFETDPRTGRRTYSAAVRQALGRGVYLLGRECFRDGVMGRVLDNIMEGKEDWCEFL
jgi:hypothetical protein